MLCDCNSGVETTWCEHIEQAMRAADDAKAGVDAFWPSLLVPIIPTGGFYAVVNLSSDEGFRAVSLLSASCYEQKVITSRHGYMTQPVYVAMPETPVIGYLGPGEGRMVIRSMISTWLRGKYKNAPACRSKIHRNYRWGKKDTHDEQLQVGEYPSLWTLLAKSICVPCLYVTTDTASDVPEL